VYNAPTATSHQSSAGAEWPRVVLNLTLLTRRVRETETAVLRARRSAPRVQRAYVRCLSLIAVLIARSHDTPRWRLSIGSERSGPV